MELSYSCELCNHQITPMGLILSFILQLRKPGLVCPRSYTYQMTEVILEPEISLSQAILPYYFQKKTGTIENSYLPDLSQAAWLVRGYVSQFFPRPLEILLSL